MKFNGIKKFLCVASLLVSMTLLSSCNVSDAIGVSDVGSAVTLRIENNKKILDRYYTAGLISKTTYDATNKQLDAKIKAFEDLTTGSSTDDKLLKNLIGSMTKVYTGLGTFTEPDGTTKNDLKATDGGYVDGSKVSLNAKNQLNSTKNDLENYLQLILIQDNSTGGYGGIFKNNDDGDNTEEVIAYELIDSTLAEELNKVLSFEIYVLDPDKFSEANGGGSIDELMTQLQMIKYSTNVSTKVNASTVSGSEATGSSADATDYWNKVLAEYYVDSGLTLNNITKVENLAVINSTNKGENYGLSEKDCGSDMTVKCSDKFNMLTIRLNEFNGSVYEQLCTNGMLDNNNWLLVKDGTNGGKLYCMNYPVSVIKTVEEQANEVFISEFETTDMYLNVYTGKTSKNGVYWGGADTDFTTVENKSEEYLTLDKSNNSDLEKSISSYVIMGSAKTPNMGYDKNGVQQDAMTARIILRDYLEATYMPDIIGSDKLVMYGRKIRFIRLPTMAEPMAKNLQLAKFVGVNGEDIEGSYEIFCDSFADIDKISASSAEINYIKRNVDKNKDAKAVPNMSENLQDALGRIGYLKYTNVSKIKMSSKLNSFPGAGVGNVDKGNNSLPLFYYVALNSEIADNGLMDWVNASNTNYGYTWWSKWLATNGYSYNLAGNSLKALFEGSYTYGSSTSGTVNLDLAVVSKLQTNLDAEADQEKSNFVVTAFILLGWLFVVCGTLLPLFWLMDTSFDMGIKFIETISFGHWIPIKEPMDLPDINMESKAYLTFGPLLVKSILVVFIGIVLIRLNIWNIVVNLIITFGGFAEQIYETFTGGL